MQVWALEGCKGGILAERTDWESFRREHVLSACRPPLCDMNHEQAADGDIWSVARYLQKAPKRRAVPSGSAPLEAWWLAFFSGNEPAIKKGKTGIGAEAGFPAALGTLRALKEGFVHVRRTMLAPLLWHRSRGAALKMSDEPGPQGKRVVHILDLLGKAFYTGKVARRKPPPPSNLDHGFLAKRRKESAILVQLLAAWRVRRAGRCFVQNNHDCTNAFAGRKGRASSARAMSVSSSGSCPAATQSSANLERSSCLDDVPLQFRRSFSGQLAAEESLPPSGSGSRT